MPKTVFFNPESQELILLASGANARADGVVFSLEGEHLVRQACKIVRDICAKRGIDQALVPVIHRVNKRPDGEIIFRYWDVRQGRSGASEYCVQLCAESWRIASKEECAAYRRRLESRRRAAKIAAVKNANDAALATAAINPHMDRNSAAPTLTAAAIAQHFSQ